MKSYIFGHLVSWTYIFIEVTKKKQLQTYTLSNQQESY